MTKLQGVLPAIRNMKDFEKVLVSNHENIIFLETRLSQIKSLVKHAHDHHKNVFLHVDLVQGLKVDEYGLEYLINDIHVDGIVTTKANVITMAKKHNITGIQRLFALDSHALDHNLKICKRVRPDYIEVLPGVIPSILKEIHEETEIPVIAGGLIRTDEDVKKALDGNAIAVTTSNIKLWEF
ncbi:glycerol-3-phosphate responsive antiterminator [Robertmurraya kyonggiensis]|uniref:Glycerol uptake operon antiterminator regulatory protein n=1 Tax=Robertmurraya kyonggiensis TaxID=1037680 RepID=A0A4U1D8X2_9BACI|nr:glycerol-3-phosphate responsive antiterminator [Robertmurraya kyonggiensis]TKC18952.1 glycerol-3-phosphate responsive antiterminator [Robertmurraya kyonggiensis]